jgi:hemoglobin
MIKHIALNQIATMERRHFDQWLRLWEETVREHFSGPKSEEAIKKAGSIAAIMELKIKPQIGIEKR